MPGFWDNDASKSRFKWIFLTPIPLYTYSLLHIQNFLWLNFEANWRERVFECEKTSSYTPCRFFFFKSAGKKKTFSKSPEISHKCVIECKEQKNRGPSFSNFWDIALHGFRSFSVFGPALEQITTYQKILSNSFSFQTQPQNLFILVY